MEKLQVTHIKHMPVYALHINYSRDICNIVQARNKEHASAYGGFVPRTLCRSFAPQSHWGSPQPQDFKLLVCRFVTLTVSSRENTVSLAVTYSVRQLCEPAD